MNDLYIEWENGHMNIHMDLFFPCTQKRFKILLKIISLDCCHKEELRERLKVYFQNRVNDLAELMLENGRKYFDYKYKAAEAEQIIYNCTYPNGLPMSEEELKRTKADLKEYTTAYKKALSDVRKNEKFKKQFEKYSELL